MGLGDWLKKKSLEKSCDNVARCIPPLVAAVRDDWAVFLAFGQATQAGDDAALARAQLRSRETKPRVAAAQKELYNSVLIWSSVPVAQMFNDVVLPTLSYGGVVALEDPHFVPCVLAAFRACEAAARHANGTELAPLVPPRIPELVAQFPTLYT